MQICLRVKYFKGGKELSKQSWEQIAPTNGAWKELDIARPIAYPEADSMQIGLGLASHTKGKLHFAKIAVSEIKDVQSVFREIPEIGLEPRDLSFLTGKKSDRFRIEGRGDSWTLVAPDGTPFYSIGSMAPWDYMPPGKLVDFVERLRAGGFNSIAAWMDLDQFLGKDFLEEFGRRKLPPMPIFHTIETYGDEDRIKSLLLRDENGATNTGEISHAFPDPFNPEFRKYYRELVAKELPLAKDNPHFIAWMQDSELSHANLHRCVFSKHASAKFVEFLKGRYPEGIKKLNGKWAANFAYGLDDEERLFIAELHKRSGRPVIITEWSVPAEDSGLYEKRKSPKMDWSWAELLPDQKIRARQAALVSREFHNIPFILGSHWFMFMDADDKKRKANRGLYKADKKTPWTELLDALSKSNLEILASHHN